MAESDTADVFDSVNEIRYRPSHAKEYKVGVYRTTGTVPAGHKTKTGGANQTRHTSRPRGRRDEGRAVRPHGAGPAPRAPGPGAPPVRAARPPDTSVSTDRAASWAA